MNELPPEKPQATLISDESVEKVLTVASALHANTQELAIEEEKSYRELTKQKLETVRLIDRNQTWFKAGIIVLCIVTLIILALKDKLLGVSPVIGVVIGAVLGTDNITSFLGSFNRSKVDDD